MAATVETTENVMKFEMDMQFCRDASGHTYTQTFRHAHGNTFHPYYGRSNNVKKRKVLPEPHGPIGCTHLHFHSPQSDTSLYCETTDKGLAHCVACLFMPQLLHRYQFILLDDRGTWV